MLCIFKRILYNFVMEKFVVDIKDIDIFASLECGQTFRFKKLNNNLYEVYSLNKYALIEKQGNLFVVSSSDIDYFYKYFALDEDYESIIKEQYEDTLKTAPLTYRFAKEDFTTGEKEYYLYAADERIGKLTLASVSTEKRLGFLHCGKRIPI